MLQNCVCALLLSRGRLHFQRTLLPEGGLCPIRCSRHSGNLPLTFDGCSVVFWKEWAKRCQQLGGASAYGKDSKLGTGLSLPLSLTPCRSSSPLSPSCYYSSQFCLGDKMRFKEAPCHLWNHLVGKWQSTGRYSDSRTGSSKTGPLSASYTN